MHLCVCVCVKESERKVGVSGAPVVRLHWPLCYCSLIINYGSPPSRAGLGGGGVCGGDNEYRAAIRTVTRPTVWGCGASEEEVEEEEEWGGLAGVLMKQAAAQDKRKATSPPSPFLSSLLSIPSWSFPSSFFYLMHFLAPFTSHASDV